MRRYIGTEIIHVTPRDVRFLELSHPSINSLCRLIKKQEQLLTYMCVNASNVYQTDKVPTGNFECELTKVAANVNRHTHTWVFLGKRNGKSFSEDLLTYRYACFCKLYSFYRMRKNQKYLP